MSMFLVTANSQYVGQNILFTTLPMTIGAWVYNRGVGVGGTIFDYIATVGLDDWALGTKSTNVFFLWGDAVETTFGTVAANTWYYVVLRLISAANRRAAVLPATGLPVHGQNTDNVSFTPDKFYVGSTNATGAYFDGCFSKFFMTDSDIQPDGLQLSNSTLYQLAYYGPFSIPHISARVVQYESWRTPMGGTQGESFYAKYPRQPWTFGGTGVPAVGIEPPIIGSYRPPNKYSPIMPRPV